VDDLGDYNRLTHGQKLNKANQIQLLGLEQRAEFANTNTQDVQINKIKMKLKKNPTIKLNKKFTIYFP